MSIVYWCNPAPTCCEICGATLEERFIDAACPGGAWAIMCPGCYTRVGARLGTGLGQLYVRQADERWQNVSG